VNPLNPERYPGESYEDYRIRRRWQANYVPLNVLRVSPIVRAIRTLWPLHRNQLGVYHAPIR
jgi:hypothetical protein